VSGGFGPWRRSAVSDRRRATASDQPVRTAVRRPRLGQWWRRSRLRTRAVGATREAARGGGGVRTVSVGTPRRDGVLTSGPDTERLRLTGGTLRQIIPELKIILNENSSKDWLEVEKKSSKIRGGRKSNLKHFS
jgi:hypothetical protein